MNGRFERHSSEPGSATELSTSSEASGVASESSTGEELDCSNGDPQVGCPSGCMDAIAYLGTGDDIDFSSGDRSCIPAGTPLDASYRSVWWRDDGTAHRFLIAGHGCGAQVPAAPLESWQECGTGADEPSECAWLCAQDVCPGDLDLDELTACSVASPCPAATQPYVCELLNRDLQCIHDALANRTPRTIRDRIPAAEPRLVVDVRGGRRRIRSGRFASVQHHVVRVGTEWHLAAEQDVRAR